MNSRQIGNRAEDRAARYLQLRLYRILERNYARNTGEIDIIAKKFDVEEVHQNIRIKIDVLKSIIEKYNLTPEEFVYIGDDINDFACLEYARYKITVPHAPEKLKNIQDIQVTENDGGEGAFREVADCLAG